MNITALFLILVVAAVVANVLLLVSQRRFMWRLHQARKAHRAARKLEEAKEPGEAPTAPVAARATRKDEPTAAEIEWLNTWLF